MSALGKIWINTLRKFSFVKGLEERIHQFEKFSSFEPGHYYSPLVAPEEFKAQQNSRLYSEDYTPPEIDFHDEEQRSLLQSFQQYYHEFPYSKPTAGLRFTLDNVFFTYSDALTMYSMIRHYQPTRIIEIGSGFSSALVLDTNELFFNNKIETTFIDPNPERLEANIKQTDHAKIIRQKIQDVDTAIFQELEEGDFLLIDTSHVSKSGSDVNHIYFNILPYLKKGVKIHIHDIFFPLEYPGKWVLEERRSWNEVFLLRAFLAYNQAFNIIFFNSYLESRNPSFFREHMPLFLERNETVCGGIWLQKTQ